MREVTVGIEQSSGAAYSATPHMLTSCAQLGSHKLSWKRKSNSENNVLRGGVHMDYVYLGNAHSVIWQFIRHYTAV